MNERIIAGLSILENTQTNKIFIADKLTEETQCKGENRNHIQKVGDLDVSVYKEIELNFIDWLMEKCDLSDDNSFWSYDGEDYSIEKLFELYTEIN